MSLSKTACCVIAVSLCCLGLAQSGTGEVVIWGSSAEKPSLPESLSLKAYDVAVNGVVFFTIRAPAAGYTVAQRGYIADLRITEVLSRGLAGPIVIKYIRGKPTIYVGPVRVITVYPQDAAAWGVGSAAVLAETWAWNLHKNLPKVVPGVVQRGPAVYEVAVNNCLLFRLRSAAGYPSLRARGADVEQKVVEVLSRGARAVTCAPTARGVGVFADGVLVVEATEADGRLVTLRPGDLAESWAENLRAALKHVSPGAPTAPEGAECGCR